ncbi:hypothetical protein ABMA28_004927 [Loxostege sticticalis]|uniref:Odorant receptor n=1 Tax=Loxostege sticticalis TaxID=481309 RepID=A0ABD0SNQ9_LOXSC
MFPKEKIDEKSGLRTEFRKFGLAYCDLPTMVDNVATFLRVLTLNIDIRHKKPIPISSYIVTTITAGSYAYVYGVSAIWFVVERCVATRDILRGIIMFSLCISSEIGNAKLCYIYYYREIIRKLLHECLSFDATVVPGSRYAMNILKTMRMAKIRAMMFWITVMGNGFLYTTKPILTPGRRFMDDIFTLYGLEPMEKSPNFEFGYALVAAAVWFLCYVPANVTAVLIVVAGYIEAQMLALTQELLHVWSDAEQYYKNLNFTVLKRGSFVDANYKKRVLNEFVTMRLIDIIQKHARNVYLLQLLEDVFRGAIALEFVLLVLGLIAELLGGLENTFLEMPYAFVQVAMDCWTGQRVMDASAQFAAAVYACKWEMFDVANKKIVLLMLASAQKTMKLSAGGVTMLSFESLMAVVRSIYSAYTTLQSTLKMNVHIK